MEKTNKFNNPASMLPMPNPSPEEQNSPLFNAIWNEIKDWDVNAPKYYTGYMGLNGSHVKIILDAIERMFTENKKKEPERHDSGLVNTGIIFKKPDEGAFVGKENDLSNDEIGLIDQLSDFRPANTNRRQHQAWKAAVNHIRHTFLQEDPDAPQYQIELEEQLDYMMVHVYKIGSDQNSGLSLETTSPMEAVAYFAQHFYNNDLLFKDVRQRIDQGNPVVTKPPVSDTGLLLKHIEIWMEGYRATGEWGLAQCVWNGYAPNFDEAVQMWIKAQGEHLVKENFRDRVLEPPQVPSTPGSKLQRYTWWGCRLFDNEEEARASFG